MLTISSLPDPPETMAMRPFRPAAVPVRAVIATARTVAISTSAGIDRRREIRRITAGEYDGKVVKAPAWIWGKSLEEHVPEGPRRSADGSGPGDTGSLHPCSLLTAEKMDRRAHCPVHHGPRVLPAMQALYSEPARSRPGATHDVVFDSAAVGHSAHRAVADSLLQVGRHDRGAGTPAPVGRKSLPTRSAPPE